MWHRSRRRTHRLRGQPRFGVVGIPDYGRSETAHMGHVAGASRADGPATVTAAQPGSGPSSTSKGPRRRWRRQRRVHHGAEERAVDGAR